MLRPVTVISRVLNVLSPGLSQVSLALVNSRCPSLDQWFCCHPWQLPFEEGFLFPFAITVSSKNWFPSEVVSTVTPVWSSVGRRHTNPFIGNASAPSWLESTKGSFCSSSTSSQHPTQGFHLWSKFADAVDDKSKIVPRKTKCFNGSPSYI